MVLITELHALPLKTNFALESLECLLLLFLNFHPFGALFQWSHWELQLVKITSITNNNSLESN